MKVKELIAKLNYVDPESEVVAISDNHEREGAIIKAKHIELITTARKVMSSFWDDREMMMCDFESYSLTGGTETIVFIK